MIKLFKKSPILKKNCIIGEIYICKLPNSVFTNAIFKVLSYIPGDDPERINIQILMVSEKPDEIKHGYIQKPLHVGEQRSVHKMALVSEHSVLLSSLKDENIS